MNGAELSILGKALVNVVINGIHRLLELIISDSQNDFLPLLGRSWLDVFYADWRKSFKKFSSIKNVNAINQKKKTILDIRKGILKCFS